jgi:PAS domain S-box-containing protein
MAFRTPTHATALHPEAGTPPRPYTQTDRLAELHARLAAVALRAPVGVACVAPGGAERVGVHGTDAGALAAGGPVRLRGEDGAGSAAAVPVPGAAAGSLCVLSPEPREWTAEEVDALAALAEGMAGQLAQLRCEEERAGAAVERHARLVDDLGAIVWEADAATLRFTFVSAHAEAMLGYPLERWREPGFWAGLLHPDDRADAVRACREASVAGRDHFLEYRVVAADGRTVWIQDTARVVREPDGAVRQLRGIMVDVTAHREALTELRRHQAGFRTLVERSPDIVTRFDLEGRHLYVSPAIERETGLPAEAFLGRTHEEFAREQGIPEPFASRWRAALAHTAETGEEELVGFEFPTVEGMRCFDCRIAPILDEEGRVEGLLAVGRDVTDRVRAEEARREAERQAQRTAGRMRAVASAAAGVLRARDLRGLHAVLRDATRGVLPYDAFTVALYDAEAHALDFLGSHGGGFVEPGEMVPLAGTPSERVIRSRRPLVTLRSDDPDSRGACPFGDPRRSESVIRVPVLDGGEVLGVLSIQSYTPDLYGPDDVEVLEAVAALAATAVRNVRHLAEREAALAALRESEEKYRALFQQSIDATFVSTPAGDLLDVNPSFLELFGWDREETRRLNAVAGYADPADRDRFREELERRGSLRDYGLRLRRRDGSALDCVVSATVRLGAGGRPAEYHGVIRDVTGQKRVTEALLQSEERHRALFEQVPAGVFFYDLDLRVTAFNERFHEMTRLPREELLGYCVRGIQDPRVLPTFEPVLRGEAASYEGPYLTPTGVEMWIVIRVAPLRDAAGRVMGGVGVVEDHTARRRAERERLQLLELEQSARAEAEMAARRARFLAEASELFTASLDPAATLENLSGLLVPRLADSCIVYLLDAEGGVQRLAAVHSDPERQARIRDRLLRYAPELDCLLPPVAHALRTGEARFVAMAEARREQENPRVRERRGDLDPGSLLVVPLRARGRILGALSLGYDSARAPDADDRGLVEEVARRAALAVDNAQLHGEVQKALQTRKRVMQAVSHDLRNPLTSIMLNSTSLLSPRVAAGLSSPVHDAVETISLAAEQMERLIQDLLDVTRLEAGHFSIDRTPQDLALLVGSGLALLQPIAERRSVRLDMRVRGELPIVRLDGGRILQVLSNLVENAIKFTPPGGEVCVTVEATGEVVRVSVADAGPGIGEEHLAHLFTPFWQAVPTGRRSAGLGLTIARGIVEAHGGRIGVESTPGRGSVFHVTLPVRPGGSPALEAPPPALAESAPAAGIPTAGPDGGGAGSAGPAPGGGPRVLVVDDNEAPRSALAYALRQAGYEVAEAADGEEGVRMARQVLPGLVLMDLSMPVMDGWTATRQLRRERGDASLPVVAVTAQILSPTEQAEAELVFDEVLAKPVTAARLLDTVGRLLAGRPAQPG